MEPILITIKNMLGLADDDFTFDKDIIVHINTVLMALTQMGVGPEDGFQITGEREKWNDFLGKNTNQIAVRTYVYLKVRLLFDPPSSSTLLDNLNKMASEYEWRIHMNVENKK